MGWQKDRRLKAGGWWECREKRRQHNATRQTNAERYARISQARRDQYDNDWRFRIAKNLNRNAARRRITLERRKQALVKEG